MYSPLKEDFNLDNLRSFLLLLFKHYTVGNTLVA